MFIVETSVDIRRPIEDVFAFAADPRNDVRWWRGVRRVELLGGDGGVGTEYAQVGRLLGLPFHNRITITEHASPSRVVLRTTKSLTPFVAVYHLTALDAGRTRFSMRAEVAAAGHFRLFGPLFAPLLRAVARFYIARLPQAL
jgi:hypothetical protein